MDGITFNKLIKQISGKISGSLIWDIKYSKNILLFNLRDYHFYINFNSSNPRIQLYENKTDFNSDYTHPFYKFLENKINRGKIINIDTINDDRIGFVEISKISPLGKKVYKLIFEFLGRRINCYLTHESKILHVLKPSRGKRALQKNDKYFPPAADRLSFFNFDKSGVLKMHEDGKKLLSIFKNIHPYLDKELKYRLKNEEKKFIEIIEEFKNDLNNDKYYIYRENKKYLLSLIRYKSAELIKESSDLITLTNLYYDKYLNKKILNNKIKNLNELIDNRVKKDEKTLKKVKKDKIKHQEYEKYKTYGDLLLAYKHKINNRSETVELDNYKTGTKEKIKIDTDKNIQENAEKYYDKYKKGKRALDKIDRRIKELKNEIEYLKNTLHFVKQIDSFENYKNIVEELQEYGVNVEKNSSRKKRKHKKKKKYRYIKYKGYKIYYGKSAKENEQVSIKLGNDDDWWFHVRNGRGSHVVIKYKGEEVPDEIFEAAAQIAVYFSQSRWGSKVSVDYTNCKYVRKPKGTPPGFVLYDNFNTIIVDQNKEFMKNLLNKRK
ncbi:MAG: DUF814 domain-containing protein [Candidatus Mcinerneyibacterium aminivorans]|uniref:DUF814 domain-containing protein n=1 Tax=Candidatus Mcinerneyibacterium aminivorans TaxID=2703815 RepID=A0A5D0MIB3_9BACT|nr:MAG: DUF814 domain-containing protein [Candidatus Mcinerneyibacterium aminivorans]